MQQKINLKISNLLLIISEYLCYLLIIFLFMDKGETFREFGIYMPPALLFMRALLMRESVINLKNPVFILLILLSLSGIIASIFSPDFLYSLKWFRKTYIEWLLVFISLSYIFQTSEMMQKLSKLFILLIIFFTAFLFYDFFFKLLSNSSNFGLIIRKYIIPLELLFPFLLLFFVSSRQKLYKIFGFIIIVLSLTAIILTGARGGWISIIIGVLIWLFGYFYQFRKFSFKVFLLIVSIICLIFLIIITISPSYINIKFDQLIKGDTSLRKELVWPLAIKSYLNLPITNKIFGNGLGRITYFSDFKKIYLMEYGKEPEEIYSPHNIYLYILYKQGILGLLIFLILIFISIKILINGLKYSKDLNMRFFGLSLLSVFTIILVHGLVEDALFQQWLLVIPLIGTYFNYLKRVENV